MKKLIYAQYCNDILKAVKKDYFIVLPESVFSLYVLATGLEKYKDKNEAIRYYYAKCNLLSYVKKPDDFKDSRERVVAELDKLSGDYKKLIEARLYMTGAIYEYDIDKAIAILNELAANGNDLAKEELAIIYFV